MTGVEYIPYHVCSSKRNPPIYRDSDRPSHLLLRLFLDYAVAQFGASPSRYQSRPTRRTRAMNPFDSNVVKASAASC